MPEHAARPTLEDRAKRTPSSLPAWFHSQTSTTFTTKQPCNATCKRAKLVGPDQLQTSPHFHSVSRSRPMGCRAVALGSFPSDTPLSPTLPLPLIFLLLTSQAQRLCSSPEQHDGNNSIRFPSQTEGKRAGKGTGLRSGHRRVSGAAAPDLRARRDNHVLPS